MTRLRFALLNAAHEGANTRRNFRREIDADLAEFDATEGQLPDHYDFDAVVVTGSRSSVYWDEEWIPKLVDYVTEAADRGCPCLGICYGHQVLAEALGGHVANMDVFELGYTEVEHYGDELFDGVGETFDVFVSHGDAVVELPPGADLLAENEYGVHAFRKDHCWGLQFHPEYDVETATDVANSKRERLDDDDRVDDVIADITEENFRAACEVKQVFENFTDYVRDRESETDAGAGVESETGPEVRTGIEAEPEAGAEFEAETGLASEETGPASDASSTIADD